MEILTNVAKFQLNLEKNWQILTDFWTVKWALRMVQRSAFCRSRRELSNAYLLAKCGFDTAENQPCKVCPLSAYGSPRCSETSSSSRRRWGRRWRKCGPSRRSAWTRSASRTRPSLSWKIRYRTFIWFFSQMIKFYRACSLPYRRQILQENFRWKALDEIYKIYMLLHRSDLNISANLCQTFSHFSANFPKYCVKLYTVNAIFQCFSSNTFYLQHFNFLLFSVPMFALSYHSFQTDPQAEYWIF